MAEKEVEDIFREEWVEEPRETMFTEDLVVVVVLVVMVEVLAAVEGTLVGEVEIILLRPVGEAGNLSMLGQISKMNAVATKLAMVSVKTASTFK